MITEVHCQSTKMLTNNVYNVRLATDMYTYIWWTKRDEMVDFEVVWLIFIKCSSVQLTL